ncbi:hypothetical protein DID88_003990 [Monilinia fructigena]|uniref:Heme haloperoxidase family profile domain-containing protein n=1 Tax=Monilinia fructigena TaxID=38457 RepID=A0A395IDV1_9HELO|nr:hypothetical protein DID88_003990 [Monilinia fructigena]
MKLNVLSITTLVFGLVAAKKSKQPIDAAEGEWVAPTKDAFRGPCPMLNTLANHGFLPRDGRNFTEHNVVNGLNHGLNFNRSLGAVMFQQAIPASPNYPNATSFTLADLNVHGVLEHDASLSRQDAYFGNNHVFDKKIFKTSKAWWPNDTITGQQFIDAKLYRQIVSRNTNPTYSFSSTVEAFSIGELVAPVVAFGDKHEITANRSLVLSWIENERLPTALGWHKPTEEITMDDILSVASALSSHVSLLTGNKTVTSTHSKRAGHFAIPL